METEQYVWAKLSCHYCAEDTNINDLTPKIWDCGNWGNYCTDCFRDINQCNVPYDYCRDKYIRNKEYINERVARIISHNIGEGVEETTDEDDDEDDDEVEEDELYEYDLNYNISNLIYTCNKTKETMECIICYDNKPCYGIFLNCEHKCCFDCFIQMEHKKCYYGCK